MPYDGVARCQGSDQALDRVRDKARGAACPFWRRQGDNGGGLVPAWIRVTCGVQQADTPEPPDGCAICADERQYVGWGLEAGVMESACGAGRA
jgi:hypothetical protein